MVTMGLCMWAAMNPNLPLPSNLQLLSAAYTSEDNAWALVLRLREAFLQSALIPALLEPGSSQPHTSDNLRLSFLDTTSRRALNQIRIYLSLFKALYISFLPTGG